MSTIELEITSESEQGRVIPITGQSVVFGRATTADVVLHWDELVSARHFQVRFESNQCHLIDLHSTNGTFVNGLRIQTCRLADGDQVDVGKTCFTVRIPYFESIERGKVMAPEAPFDPYGSFSRALAVSPPRSGTISKPDPPNEDRIQQEASSATTITQLCLRIVSAPETSRLFWLTPGQSLTFGQDAKSDCCLGFDVQLSSQHFRITCSSDSCIAEDLQSTNGTFLNGQAISQANIFRSDRLRAGQTEFEIEVQGAAELINRQVPVTSASAIAAVSTARGNLEVIKSTCASGLTRLQCTIPENASITGILERLCGLGDFYFIIDFSRIGAPLPPEVDVDASSLFSWLPREAANQTPQVVSMAEISDWKTYLEEGWGNDAIVCLQSDLDKASLLSALCDMALGSAKPGTSSLGVSGFCWPSVMNAMLENDTQSFTPQFMKIANIIVTEVAGKAEAWQLYASEETVEKCRNFGLTF